MEADRFSRAPQRISWRAWSRSGRRGRAADWRLVLWGVRAEEMMVKMQDGACETHPASPPVIPDGYARREPGSNFFCPFPYFPYLGKMTIWMRDAPMPAPRPRRRPRVARPLRRRARSPGASTARLRSRRCRAPPEGIMWAGTGMTRARPLASSPRDRPGPRNIRMEAVLGNQALAHIYPLFSWAFGPQIYPFSGAAS